MQSIDIFRGTALILSVKPNDNSNVKQSIMGDWLLTLQFDIDKEIELLIGDTTTVYGTTYYVHATKMPVLTKKGTYLYEYDIQMVSCQYLLQNAQYLFLGDDNTLKQPDWSLHGTASDFIDVLIQNAQRTGYNFTKGDVIQTGYKDITFSSVDCLSALGTLATEFDTEWFVEDFKVYLAKKQKARPLSFKYGKNKGFYDIKRTPADNAPIVTRLYVFGGTQNIPTNYRNFSTRLLLPAIADPKLVSDVTYTVVNNGNGTQTITFHWTKPVDPSITQTTVNLRNTGGADTIFTTYYAGTQNFLGTPVPLGMYEVYFETFTSGTTGFVSAAKTPIITVTSVSSPYVVLPGTDVAYIEHNTDLYGIIERTLIIDDIYPHRTGIVTAVNALDPYSFSDSSLDFDINNQLLPGTSAKVVFNTGQLAGYTFEIREGGYNNVTKTITILKNKDEKTIDVPSFLLHPAIGDEYVLIDIFMPQSYIDAAESQLLQKAQDYLNTNSTPNYNYSVTCDPVYFRRKNITLAYGDIVQIQDVELGINKTIRILSVTRQLTDEYTYSIELGDTIAPGTLTQLQAAQTSNSNGIDNINSALNNNRLLAGTNVGNFSIEQGTLVMKDIETASSTAGMKQLYIDSNGKVWKA